MVRNPAASPAATAVPSIGLASAEHSAVPIRAAVIHFMSRPMETGETTLKDTALMLVARQRRVGGVLDRPRQAVIVDPASDRPLLAEEAW